MAPASGNRGLHGQDVGLSSIGAAALSLIGLPVGGGGCQSEHAIRCHCSYQVHALNPPYLS
jgi:hypothetical protein